MIARTYPPLHKDQLVRILRGPFTGMTGRVVSITADELRVRLTCQSRHVRIPRDGTWCVAVDDAPQTAAQARAALAGRDTA